MNALGLIVLRASPTAQSHVCMVDCCAARHAIWTNAAEAGTPFEADGARGLKSRTDGAEGLLRGAEGLGFSRV